MDADKHCNYSGGEFTGRDWLFAFRPIKPPGKESNSKNEAAAETIKSNAEGIPPSTVHDAYRRWCHACLDLEQYLEPGKCGGGEFRNAWNTFGAAQEWEKYWRENDKDWWFTFQPR